MGHGDGSKAYGVAERLLHEAVNLGINFFDTADLYDQGHNEIVVGKALKPKRKELYIATKVGNQLRPDGSGWDWNPSKDYILKAVDESLKRLGTDYIDLYQLHGGTIDDPIDETIEAFEILKEQGKIRAYGISSIRPNVIREYVARSNMVSVMMQYSLLDRRPEESCLPLLEENSIGVLVRGAVAQGLLADKPAKEYLGYSVEQVESVKSTLARVTGSGKSATQTAIQFVQNGPAVYSVAAGMRTEEQLVENAGTFDAPGMSEQEYRQLQGVLEPKVYEQHR
jgi:aryl-alcohol dehydrogenase-like predicted oxidoreductase